MNYSEQSVQNTLPQFSELSACNNVTTLNYPLEGTEHLQISQQISYATAIDGNNGKSTLINSQVHQQQNLSEYLQRIQSSSLPIHLQQLIKLQSGHIKKDKESDQKFEQIQNILNIPAVPVYKILEQMQSDSQYINSEHSLISLNPSDVNVHMEEQQPESHTQNQDQSNKMDQNTQSESSSRSEKKMKFKVKTGEIKTTVALDGSTLYCCPECNLAFAQKSDIEQHLEIHWQERKYQCKECGAMLKRKEHLDQHMRGHSDERPFKCPACQKAFKRNEHLTRHYVIHSGDKNFTCQVCQKAFSRKDHLNKHTQTHLGIKKTKAKKEPAAEAGSTSRVTLSNNDSSPTSSPMLLRPDINNFVKDGNLKQDNTHFIIQNIQKDHQNLAQFSAFKEQILKDGSTIQQQAVNMNEILPQNTRYLMPS